MKRTTLRPEILLPMQRFGELSLRVQLQQALRAAVFDGRLPAGTRLPSTRTLAADLGLSRGVVVDAYEQLVAEGYLSACGGSATRVARRQSCAIPAGPPEAVVPSFRYDFSPGMPDVSMFPRGAWLRSLRRALALSSDAPLGYPNPRGHQRARTALSTYLNRARGTVARTDTVVLCTGFAQGLTLVCQVLRDRGVKRLAVEDPWNPEDLRPGDIEILRIPVDRDGLQVDQLRRSDVGAVLVTPAHQYPTGAVLAPNRRTALLDWAARRQAIIIEDDYDAEYRYDRKPIGSLQGLAPDRVVYVGSASKTLAPALRMGWLVVPGDLVGDVATAKLRADRGSPVLEQIALADFIERGELDRHLRRTRLVYRGRRDALVAALASKLPQFRVHGVAAGLQLMIELDADANEEVIINRAAALSVRVCGVRIGRGPRGAGSPALLLGYGALTESAIVEGIERLASVIPRHSRAARAVKAMTAQNRKSPSPREASRNLR